MRRGISLGILGGISVRAETRLQRPNPRQRTAQEQKAGLSQRDRTNRPRGTIVRRLRNRTIGRNQMNRSPTGHNRLQTTARRKRDPTRRQSAMIVRLRLRRKIVLSRIRRREMSRRPADPSRIDRNRIVQSRRRATIGYLRHNRTIVRPSHLGMIGRRRLLL